MLNRFSPPCQVGKYTLGKTLGEGTFGKVKLAVNTVTGEKVRRSGHVRVSGDGARGAAVAARVRRA